MRKRALLVGINYQNSQNPLRGCINDITAINEVLVNKLSFTDPREIRMLTEQSATTSNILERLEWLVDGAQPGDVLYFHFSGHGTQICTQSYEEEIDGMDECIVPYDMDWRTKIIKDGDFKRIFNKVPSGVNLSVTLDCCHSGDGLRDFLPPVEFRDNILGPTRNRGISAPVDIQNRAYGLDLDFKPRVLQNPNIIPVEDQTGLLISGCKSNQTSADAWIQPAGKFYGALTYTMLYLLQLYNYKISYREIIVQLNELLPRGGFTQHPELNGKESLFDKQFLSQF